MRLTSVGINALADKNLNTVLENAPRSGNETGLSFSIRASGGHRMVLRLSKDAVMELRDSRYREAVLERIITESFWTLDGTQEGYTLPSLNDYRPEVLIALVSLSRLDVKGIKGSRVELDLDTGKAVQSYYERDAICRRPAGTNKYTCTKLTNLPRI